MSHVKLQKYTGVKKPYLRTVQTVDKVRDEIPDFVYSQSGDKIPALINYLPY